MRRLGLRLTIDGYCLIFHMRDGRFDAIREYINPPNIAAGLLVYVLLMLLPYLSKTGYRDSGNRYRDMATSLGFDGHIAWAEAMT